MGRKALDVLKQVCDQLGWDQIVSVENEDTLTKDDRKLVRALNRTLRVLSGVQDWRFLRAEGEIITIAEYTQGTARVTNGSTAVTGQDDPDITGTLLPSWTAAMVGRAFVASGVPLIYRITAVNSATSLTLDREWQGDSTGPAAGPDGEDVDDLSYQILQDRYDMPLDMDRPADADWSLFNGTSVSTVTVVDPSAIRARRTGRMPAASAADPDAVALWMHDSQGEHRVAVLDPFPSEQRVITFEYQKIHPVIDRDTQRILFPPRYEEVVADGVEFLLREGPDDDNRTDLALAEYLRTRAETAAAREIGQKRIRLTPSQHRAYQQHAKWGRRGLRMNWGSSFDRVDFYNLPR
jgi:hypothetical protein